MKTKIKANVYILSFIAVILHLASASTAVAAMVDETARWMPDNVMLFVCADDLKTLEEKFHKTGMYGLYKDPAMAPFIEASREKIKEKINESLKELWEEIGMENPPQDIPYPQGRMMLGVFIQAVEREIPDFSEVDYSQIEMDENFDWEEYTEKLPRKKIKTPDVQVVFMANMGENIEKVCSVITGITDKMVEEGESHRRRESIRGLEIQAFPSEEDGDVDIDTFCYSVQGEWLIAGSSLKYLKEAVLCREGERDNLSDCEAFKTQFRKLGDDADMFLFVNAQPIIDVVNQCAQTPADATRTTTIIHELGLDDITGAAMALQLAPGREADLCAKVFLAVKGEKRGIPDLLAPESKPLSVPRFIGKDTESFVLAHYDFGQLYDGIIKIANAITHMDVNIMAQSLLMSTAQEGSPPVMIKQDIFDQLSGPFVCARSLTKPFNQAESAGYIFNVGVRNTAVLEAALSRLHSVFIAENDPELTRKMLDKTIYLLPAMPFNPFMMYFDEADEEDGEPFHMAFSFMGDTLMLSSVKKVEQAIRDNQRDDVETILLDPMFQKAKDHFPKQAGIYAYGNFQRSLEFLWHIIKTPENNIINDELKEIIDVNLLPDYSAVKQYFGAYTSHISDTEDGVYGETSIFWFRD